MISRVKAAGGTIPSNSDSLTLKLKPSIEGLVKQGRQYGLMSDPDIDPDLRSLQHMLLFGIKGMAAYTDHAAEHGQEKEANYEFIHRGLAALEDRSLDANAYLGLILECGEKNLSAMALLSNGNSEAYRDPVPTKVPLGAKKGKAILVSGHDFIDLESVLKATAGTGINVYTHGEMLPAHGYPRLKERFPHFYGHYGTAWQNQKKEFEKFPGAILVTSNCIQKPRQSYKKNIFTSGTVGMPGLTHLHKNNMQPLVDRAMELPGYAADKPDMEILFILSWYEQKAVAILYSLLYLGIKDIHLGPSLPAFVTPNVLNILVKNYNITPLGTPEADLKKILG